jgi:chemotaxis protein MotB
MKRNPKISEEEGGKWLSTFNDMVTLLLTFFVLILSLSTPDVGKFEEIADSISTAFGMFETGSKIDIGVFTPFVISLKKKGSKTFKDKGRTLAGSINKAANSVPGIKGNTIEVKTIKEGVSVVLGEKLLFKTGMAEIEEKNNSIFKKVLFQIFQENHCQIRVEGHTDDVPISNERFSSNWELSMVRAVNVVKYLISEGNILPERLSASGYADSKPLVPNVSDHNRELNRRVEIILTLNKD